MSNNGPKHNCPLTGICQNANLDPARLSEGPESTGPLQGRKRNIYKGRHCVPGIVLWPSYYFGGRETWKTGSMVNFLQTIIELSNLTRPPEQQDWAMDGWSILALLQGKAWIDTKEEERNMRWGFAKSTLKNDWIWGY